ncbi:MAG: right-handed parallel beta-helix repeat-containing protein [Sphaerochaetaceae bacterium]|jgi:nitrous oxidase accessory protein NosD|nr:right-handed parallel beta-helix repeat-containing protein [Sphaerochaetaceae bacterium]MDD4220528.1 right-handed parallel beta-helix repeat-containing protein [Sphaerochaetaceae bacterium]
MHNNYYYNGVINGKKGLPSALLIILLITATMVACDDSPVRVIMVAKSGGEYDTIQAAIDGAENGNTILIEAGTYTENVYINKRLTLKADADVIVDGTVQITVEDVKIEGLTVKPKATHRIPGISSPIAFFVGARAKVSFDNVIVDGGNPDNIGTKKGIKAMPGAAFTVKNSTFENLKTGIFVNGIKESTRTTMAADDNTFTNNWAGIGGTESSDVTITNNTFESIAPGGEGIGLGEGVVMYDAEGTAIDENALEDTNTFTYTEGNKVKDYRDIT